MKKVSGLLRSFFYAGRGIVFCLRHERHFRIHLVSAAYVIFFSLFYDFTATDYAVLILTCAVVIAAEIFNTAIEVVIDKVSPRFSVFAMMGKDIAAGAVLFTAIGAIAVGFFMFWDIPVFVRIFEFFAADWWKPVIFLIVTALAVWFIFSNKPRTTGNKHNSDHVRTDEENITASGENNE